MKRSAQRIFPLILGIVISSLLGSFCPVSAQEPTLARLAFWVPPERMGEFGVAYAEQVAPLLKKHGLVASSERGRATVDSVFSRLFEFPSPDAFVKARDRIADATQWSELLGQLGSVLNLEAPDQPLRYQFDPYCTPIGSGYAQEAGKGIRQGVWHTFTPADGFSNPHVRDVLYDRRGDLWFGIDFDGVVRYDGRSFTTFSREDGLAGRDVSSIVMDRSGKLWIGHGSWLGNQGGGGITCFDGESFVVYTTVDGLAHEVVLDLLIDSQGRLWAGTAGGLSLFDGERFRPMLDSGGQPLGFVEVLYEDRAGNIWIGTRGRGVLCYDGWEWSAFTQEDGLAGDQIYSMTEDREGRMWFGTYPGEGVSRFDGKQFVNFTAKDGLPDDEIWSLFTDSAGHVWIGTGDGLARYDGEGFLTFDTANSGLVSDWIFSMFEDPVGQLWIATGGGLTRYDGALFTSFTPEDGLIDDETMCLLEDREGRLWIGTMRGVSVFDGERFSDFPGFERNVWSILEDSQGDLWFGITWKGSLSRYDGETLVSFSTEDGLAQPWVRGMLEDRQGNLWFGHWGWDQRATTGGLTRYDGKEFVTYTVADGLPANPVIGVIEEDRSGNLWLGTFASGLIRFDGKDFTAFTTVDGLLDNDIGALFEDGDGTLWVGTARGVNHYDGKEFTTLSVAEGNVIKRLECIMQDTRGHFWFGSWGGGVSRYDGLVLQRLRDIDRLIGPQVHDVIETRNGEMWIAAEVGIVRYRHSEIPPSIFLVDVVTDRRLGPLDEIYLDGPQKRIGFSFQGSSLTTPVDDLAYVYRLRGHEESWQSIYTGSIDFFDLPVGEYEFQVKAVDRDLNYSTKPATVRVVVNPSYRMLALVGSLGFSLLGLVLASGYALRKRRDQHRAERALMQEMEEELQTAHDMQMGLMPTEAPQVPGFEIVGHCLPANHVGGDFFQYFPQNGKLSIALADVTGHAMEAAVPVMMFSGILKSQMEIGGSVEDIFGRLNRSLHGTLDKRTFVCFTMGELDPETRTFRFANGGCPYPYHFQASTEEISELQLDAYPLAIRQESEYQAIDIQLEQGDVIVFCSDGIIEAENGEGEIYGFERTAETVRQGCSEELSAEALIDRLIGAVKDFAGDVPQGDDMTVVVLKVET